MDLVSEARKGAARCVGATAHGWGRCACGTVMLLLRAVLGAKPRVALGALDRDMEHRSTRRGGTLACRGPYGLLAIFGEYNLTSTKGNGRRSPVPLELALRLLGRCAAHPAAGRLATKRAQRREKFPHALRARVCVRRGVVGAEFVLACLAHQREELFAPARETGRADEEHRPRVALGARGHGVPVRLGSMRIFAGACGRREPVTQVGAAPCAL